jgi:hypothetical protein
MKKSPVLMKSEGDWWKTTAGHPYACQSILRGLYDLLDFERIRIVVRSEPSSHSIAVRSTYGRFYYCDFPDASFVPIEETYMPAGLRRMMWSVAQGRDTVYVEIEEA